MFDVQAILTRARSLGLTLCVEGNRIAITPARLCPPELLAELREHKPVVMSLLEAKAADLTWDQQPWLYVARQILHGEFEGADRSTTRSLLIGLGSIAHPICQKAIARLKAER